MKKKLYVAFASIAAASLVLTSCSSSDDTAATDTASESAATEEAEATEEAAAGDAGTACVILPDSQSSDRWENQDRPAIQNALEAAGFSADIPTRH